MKLNKIFLIAVLALGLGACSHKDKTNPQEETEIAEAAVENGPVLTAPVATDGKVVVLDDAKFLTPGVKVEQLTVVDFNAVWCGPCRQLAPVIEEMAKKYAGKVTFVSVDVDKFPELMDAYNLGNAIPVVLFMRPDGIHEHYVGIGDLLPADKFEEVLKKYL